AGEHWLDALPAEHEPGGPLPAVVRAVASRARAHTTSGADSHGPGTDPGAATARVRARTGQWLVARASMLGAGPGARVAVLLEVARPPELAPLIAAAYGFTDSERRVTELIARGPSTNDIADRLHLSAYTVQDHLKSVFRKTCSSSRAALVAHLLFPH